ncbi:unnamed protein product [Nesidiocoris tenuis]|uniref:Uncharacterized protein n=1 Tax=Nesidiocoris tenuis TaxID=355587 RepID=A0A6H5GCH2_9HEMI|nr:unnamed protein product [Nesidiocoris tenuis]
MEDGLMVLWRYVDQFRLTQLDRKPVQQVYHLLMQLQMVGAFQELLHVLHWRDHVVDLRQPVKSFGRFVHYMLRIRDQPYIIARRDVLQAILLVLPLLPDIPAMFHTPSWPAFSQSGGRCVTIAVDKCHGRCCQHYRHDNRRMGTVDRCYAD